LNCGGLTAQYKDEIELRTCAEGGRRRMQWSRSNGTNKKKREEDEEKKRRKGAPQTQGIKA